MIRDKERVEAYWEHKRSPVQGELPVEACENCSKFVQHYVLVGKEYHETGGGHCIKKPRARHRKKCEHCEDYVRKV